jgi:HEAT repeat protein
MPKDKDLELDRLVQRLAAKGTRHQAIVDLVGGITATELRDVDVPDDVFDALTRGLRDPNPKIRWWCIQLLDHVPDERALQAVVPLLDDPVDRVRRNAVHALGCAACKPTSDATLPESSLTKVEAMAAGDPSGKVRREAAHALACRTEARS